MESVENNAKYETSWTPATNWTVAGGSLAHSVTLESSLSLTSNVDDDDDNNDDESSSGNPNSKSPLILYTPSSDSAPCEITIKFAQKHEVRQVYVRSTARVYEIYCASELQSSSEYLCTVRCGIAARDDKVLHATDVEEVVLAHVRSSTQEPSEEKLRNGSNPSPNEDDWVEVKALDSPMVVNRNSFSSSNSDMNPERNSQDLCEATAEISDASPCMSITLRLLSFQNKGYVCIDEVYVFGDLADMSNLDYQVGPKENSAGSSLMNMLVPAFFQLSKTNGIGGGQHKNNIDTREMQKSLKIGLKADAPVDVEYKIREDVRLQEAIGPSSKLVQQEIPEVSNKESKPDISSHNHIEGALDQLVSRVKRIEDLFLRFEESMLKPINNIDVRLQRVEQQLDVLMKRTENSTFLSGTRISAPDFSCSASETNSLYNSGSRDISYLACETNKNSSPSDLLSTLPGAVPVSVNGTSLQPGLLVTAPEFSNYDDEEEVHVVESGKKSPKDMQKHTMSIDDALAYALAGFLSSTSIQSHKYLQTLAVKFSDFPSEEDNNNDKVAPSMVESELNMDPSGCFNESDWTEHMGDSPSSCSKITSLEGDEKAMRSLNDNNSLKMAEILYKKCQHSNGGEGDLQDTCTGHVVSPATHDVGKTDSCQVTDDIKDGGARDEISDVSVEKTESLEQFPGNQTDYGSAPIQDVAVSNELVASTEITEESKEEILQNIVKFSCAPSVVDFETPILEVKFVSQDTLDTKSPLEALLAGMPDLEVEVPLVMGNNNDGSQDGDRCDLISVEDCEVIGSGTDTHISVDLDYCSLNEMPPDIEADKLQDCYTSNSSSPGTPLAAASLI